MESWKAFDQNTVSHSVAHHLVTIAELLDEYGYARVSDVARRLEITRGSASITLKGLKKRGLVVDDSRRFLGLSEEGMQIARSIQARKKVMLRFLVHVLGVAPEQADIDTCKIEHLISGETADLTGKLLDFLESGSDEAVAFRKSFTKFRERAETNPEYYPPDEEPTEGAA